MAYLQIKKNTGFDLFTLSFFAVLLMHSLNQILDSQLANNIPELQ